MDVFRVAIVNGLNSQIMSGRFLKKLGWEGEKSVLEKVPNFLALRCVPAGVGTDIVLTKILLKREGALRVRVRRASASAMDRSVVSESDSDSLCVLAVSKGWAQESIAGTAKDKNTKMN